MIDFLQWLNENYEDENPYFWDKDSAGYKQHEYKKFIRLVDNFCKNVNRHIVPEGFELYPYNYSNYGNNETGIDFEKNSKINKVMIGLNLPIGSRYRFSITLNQGEWFVEGILSSANWVQGLDRPIQYRELTTIFLNIVRSIQEKGFKVATYPNGKKFKTPPDNGFDHQIGEIT